MLRWMNTNGRGTRKRCNYARKRVKRPSCWCKKKGTKKHGRSHAPIIGINDNCWRIREKPYTLETSGLLKFMRFSSNVRKWQPNLASSRKSTIHFRVIKTREALEPGTCEALESWTCEALESWTCEAPESGICEIRESNEVQIRRLWRMKIFMYKRFGNQQEVKSKTLPQKSGFDVWTSGKLVNVWN
jgi:hypothetical protein